MSDITLLIDFDFIGTEFWLGGNVKPSRIKGLVEDYLRTQMGQGEDPTEANEIDCYEIDISVDLSHDIFKCRHNCGNKGLREGILLYLLKKLRGELTLVKSLPQPTKSALAVDENKGKSGS